MKIGEMFPIPNERGCGDKGEIVWMSEDGKTIGVKCSKYHSKDYLSGTNYRARVKAGYGFHDTKTKKTDVVYLIDVSDSLV